MLRRVKPGHVLSAWVCLVIACTAILLTLVVLRQSRRAPRIPHEGRGMSQVWRRTPKIAILMVAVNYEPADVSTPLWEMYCDRYGYDFIKVTDETYDDPEFGVAWWRVRKMRELLNVYDVVMHVDGDAMPMRPDISITDWMKGHGTPSTVMWLSKDVGDDRHPFGSVNFGIFIMTSSDVCKRLLDIMWPQRFDRTVWPREQGCMEDEVQNIFATDREMYDSHIDIAEYGTMQDFTDPYGGCWIFHAAGQRGDELMQVMRDTARSCRVRLLKSQ